MYELIRHRIYSKIHNDSTSIFHIIENSLGHSELIVIINKYNIDQSQSQIYIQFVIKQKYYGKKPYYKPFINIYLFNSLTIL